jgi:hypothetical protein
VQQQYRAAAFGTCGDRGEGTRGRRDAQVFHSPNGIDPMNKRCA